MPIAYETIPGDPAPPRQRSWRAFATVGAGLLLGVCAVAALSQLGADVTVDASDKPGSDKPGQPECRQQNDMLNKKQVARQEKGDNLKFVCCKKGDVTKCVAEDKCKADAKEGTMFKGTPVEARLCKKEMPVPAKLEKATCAPEQLSPVQQERQKSGTTHVCCTRPDEEPSCVNEEMCKQKQDESGTRVKNGKCPEEYTEITEVSVKAATCELDDSADPSRRSKTSLRWAPRMKAQKEANLDFEFVCCKKMDPEGSKKTHCVPKNKCQSGHGKDFFEGVRKHISKCREEMSDEK